MENAPERRINSFSESLLSLSKKIEGLDSDFISAVLKEYENIPSEWKIIPKLREKMHELHPNLFSRTTLSGEGKELVLDDANDSGETGTETDPQAIFESVKASLTEQEQFIEEVRNRIEKIFSADNCKHSFRIKSSQSFSENFQKRGKRLSLIDIVGIRIVPRDSGVLPEMIRRFEEEMGNDIAFKLNTFAFSEKEIAEKIGENSIYYRAVHYYLPVDNFFIEVQIRTPGVDQWSIMHHDTVYKPKVPVSEEERGQIMEFGKVANVVDYFNLIK